MTIQRIQCPGCGTTANVPSAMANVRCPACGMVWNPSQPQAKRPAAAAPTPALSKAGGKPNASNESPKQSNAPIIAGVIGGVVMMFSMLGVLAFMITRRAPAPVEASPVSSEVAEAPAAPTYREVNLPEEHRKRIYDDYRKMARTTIEKPLLLPDSKVRDNFEEMLQKTNDNGVMQLAELNNITIDDMHQIVAEGDAKNWDPTPRSHATRGGQRVNPIEKSKGYKPKGPLDP